MLLSIVFVLSVLLLGTLICIAPKREQQLNLAVWMIYSICSVYAVWIFCVGWMNLFHISIGLESILVLNLVLCVILGGYIGKKKRIQKFLVSWTDLTVLAVLAVGAYVLVVLRQGTDFLAFQYAADDSARHLEYALKLYGEHKLNTGRYALYLLNAIVMWVISSFTDYRYVYKAFSITDVMLLFMTAAIFWVWVRTIARNKFQRILAFILTLVVTLGFTWNIVLFGFGYLIVGVLMITFLMVLLEQFDKGMVTLFETIMVVMFLNTAINVSYSLFAPAVYVAETGYFFFWLLKKKKIFSIDTVLLCMFDMLIPVYLCVYYVAGDLLGNYAPLVTGAVLALAVAVFVIKRLRMHRHKSKKSSHKKKFRQFFDSHRILKCICIVFAVVAILYFLYRYAYIGMMLRFMAITGAFELDGNIYRNPYGDFVLILFPILIYIVNALKNKKNDPLLWNMATMVGFSFWLIRYVLYGLVGSYYFYKMHFIIWILAWAMVYKVVISLKKDGLYYAGVYGLMVLMLLGVHVSGMEKKNNEYNYFFWPTQLTNEFFGIYDYNIRLMKEGGTLDQELLDATREILTIREKEASYVPIFGDEVKYYKDYFYVFSGQDRYAHPHWLFDENAVSDDIVQSLREIGAGYVCVKNDYFVEEGIYADDFIYWENVWSNSGYVIYKVPA